MDDLARLTSYTKGDGPYHDEIHVSIEALIRRQVANALRVPPEAVTLDKGDLRDLIAAAHNAFDNAMADRCAELRKGVDDV